MIRKIILLINLLVMSNAYALQKIKLLPDVVTNVVASKQGLNILRIEHGSVERVVAPRFIEVQHDPKQNDLVFKFLQSEAESAEVAITSTSGYQYLLKLIPTDIDMEIIVLVNDKENTSALADGGSYPQKLGDLLGAMYRQEPIEGYRIESVCEKKKSPRGKPVEIRTIYSGNGIRGEIYHVKNLSKQRQVLAERMFYQAGVRAISIAKPSLAPGETSRVFIMKDSAQ